MEEKWFLTRDGVFDYSVFVGTKPPKVEEYSGIPRFVSNSHCKSAFYSAKGEMFEKIFGVKLGPLQCREIPPILIGPLKESVAA